ncbi:hypothetical protein RUM43_009074 [Polyplax serrata]|uniref:Uncharacterized protein n=1 Tax=Polyplax serrata TaxID=468196 RepID=A0AAN8S8C9_POLSC
MKTGLVILLFLDVVKTEFRHHQQQQDRYGKQNHTLVPDWSPMTGQKSKKVIGAPEMVTYDGAKRGGGGAAAAAATEEEKSTAADGPGENSTKSKDFDPGESEKKFLDGNVESNQNKSVPSVRKETEGESGNRKTIENQTEMVSPGLKIRTRGKKKTNRVLEMENLKKDEEMENSGLLLSKSVEGKPRKMSDNESLGQVGSRNVNGNVTSGNYHSGYNSSELVQDSTTEIQSENEFDSVSGGESGEYLNLNRDVLNLQFAEPLVSMTETDKPEGCVETPVDGYQVLDSDVTEDVLSNRKEAENLAHMLMVSFCYY